MKGILSKKNSKRQAILLRIMAHSINLCIPDIERIKLPSAVTLGGAFDGGGTSPVGQQSRDLLQWAVGLHQQQRVGYSWRRQVTA